MTRLTVSDFPPSDQHRLQEWVRSLSGALTAARPALPAVCFRFERRNEVRSSLWMFKSFIFTSPFTARTSPCHYSDSSQRIKKGKRKKSLGRKFHTCKGSKLKIPKWFASTDGRQQWLQYEERRRRAESHYGSYSVCTVSSEHWYVYVTHLVAWGAGKEAVDPVFRKLCFCCGPGQEHSR